jgi:hypothetical protein
MGSLRSDGTRITQARSSTRNIGAAQTLSADRVESEVTRDGVTTLGTEASIALAQYSTLSLSSVIKTASSPTDVLIDRQATLIEAPSDDPADTQKAYRHTGNRVSIGDSINDDVLGRDKNG